jgi:hypothetical protein
LIGATNRQIFAKLGFLRQKDEDRCTDHGRSPENEDRSVSSRVSKAKSIG